MIDTQFHRKEDYQTVFYDVNTTGQRKAMLQERYEMIFVQKGYIECWLEDQFYRVMAGDVLLVPAGVMFSVTTKSKGMPLQFYHIQVSPRFLHFLKVQDPEMDSNFVRTVANKRYMFRLPPEDMILLCQAFESLIIEETRNDSSTNISCAALISVLLVRVNRLIGNATQEQLLQGEDNRLAGVLTYIHDHCTEALSVDELAEMFSFSASHLAHSFKKQLGVSLYHYVLLRRLQIGRNEMLNNVPVKEAYLKCGFGDYAGFYRAFMKEFGISPQKYKQKYTKEFNYS